MKSNTQSQIKSNINQHSADHTSAREHQLYNLLFTGKISMKEYLQSLKTINEKQ